MEEMAVVFMVAGMSSRFGGRMKQFAKVGPEGESLIEYSLNEALQAGFSKIVFIVGEKTDEEFKRVFGNEYKGVQVLYAFQNFDKEKRDRPWGTVDALCSLRGVIDCPFVVCNGDDIYGADSFKKLTKHLRSEEGEATVGYNLKDVLPDKGSVNRGIFSVDGKGDVESIVENFDINMENYVSKGLRDESLCSMNIFGFHLGALELLSEILIKFKRENIDDRKIECLLPNEIGNLVKNGSLKVKIYSTEGRYFGVTNPEDESVVREQLKGIR